MVVVVVRFCVFGLEGGSLLQHRALGKIGARSLPWAPEMIPSVGATDMGTTFPTIADISNNILRLL